MRIVPVLAAVLALGISGCRTTDKSAQSFERDWATWKTKPEGTVAKISTERREIVRDQAAWEALWQGPAPEVDFEREMVLVATRKYAEHPADLVRIWRVVVDEETGQRSVLVKVGQIGGDFENKPLYGPCFHFAVVPAIDSKFRWKDIKVQYDTDNNVDSLEHVKTYE